jgi:beta-lactamase class A
VRTVLFALVLVAASLARAGAQAPPAVVSSPAPTPAASELARERVDALLRAGHADAAWFSASFLAQVSTARLDTILAQLGTALGAYEGLDGGQGDYTARFAKGTDEVLVHLDAARRIDGLFFKPPKQRAASLDDALRALQPVRGTLSYVIMEGTSERAGREPATPLAVGSAFKLAVLAALRDEIARGRRHWNDVVPLNERWKSLPSGVLRTWPTGTPLTLATYAAEMISISDNTAADSLVRLAGPAALAPYAGNNVPFLTTREAFVLTSDSGAAQRDAYLAAPEAAARAAVLRTVDTMPLPPLSTLAPQPILAIEWHYSVRELCALMGRVADLPLMAINPGVADRASFRQVAFKGGSDTGVVNLTTQVVTKRGTRVCFSATLNDEAQEVDATAFETAYGSVLGALAER